MPTGRFAPSPTGPLHLGNLRTALIAWLFARSAGSRFLVRIEDLDPVASRDEWVEQHLADLAAIGLDWDPPVVRQSARRADHLAAIAALDEAGLLYPCWCTRREIAEAAQAAHGPLPEGAYPGTCLRSPRPRDDRPPAWRARAGGALIGFEDAVHGPVEGLVDDFVVQRGDGTPAYNLAVVVDDAWQGIEQVVRGDDLLLGTPRQVWLARALDVTVPAYAHVPLVLNAAGQRLAKRDGAVTLADGLDPADVRARLDASLGPAGASPDTFDPTLLLRSPWFVRSERSDSER